MMHHFSQVLVIFAGLVSQCLIEAQKGEAMVHLRVEGDEGTIFDGKILTKAMRVASESGGTHKCDGTNNRMNTIPGATVTGALHSAADVAGFTWDGTYWPSLDDYSITRIGKDYQTDSKHWSILLNFNYIPVGGCQQQVKQGDQILFAYNVAKKYHFLQLEISHELVQVGDPLTVLVTDARTGQPISGATIANQVTDVDGQATIRFKRLGSQKLQAEHPDAVRSNTVFVSVSR